jgi:hypothetical protein
LAGTHVTSDVEEKTLLEMKTVVLESTFNKGILDLPGCTPDSKQKIKQLLTSDYNNHHCFFNAIGLHNHLPHQYVSSLLYVTIK